MSDQLLNVDEVAQQLKLHPKTVLRYIHDGRLPAVRVGKSYRISRAELDAFAGFSSGRTRMDLSAHTTCVTEIPDLTMEEAERIASFLQSAAMSGHGDMPRLHLHTAYDPFVRALKAVVIGSPSHVGRLLEMLDLNIGMRR